MKLLPLFLLILSLNLNSQTDSIKTKAIYTGLNYKTPLINNTKGPQAAVIMPERSIRTSQPLMGYLFSDSRANLNEILIKDLNLFTIDRTEYINFSNPILLEEKINYFSVATSYHKTIKLNKEKAPKWFLGLGGGVSAYYTRYNTKPYISTYFPFTENKAGLQWSIKPLIQYSLSDRVFIGVSSLLNVMEQNIHVEKEENPGIPLSEQKTTSFNTLFFPSQLFEHQIQVGIFF